MGFWPSAAKYSAMQAGGGANGDVAQDAGGEAAAKSLQGLGQCGRGSRLAGGPRRAGLFAEG